MALIKCTDCGHEMSAAATICTYCGKPNAMVSTVAPKKISWPALIGFLVFGTIVITMIAGYIATHDDSPAPAIHASSVAPISAAVPTTPESTENDKPRSRAENAQLYSDYVGQIQSTLFVSSMITVELIDKLKRDFAFARTDAVQQDLELLDQQSKKQSHAIIEIRPKQPVDEAEYDSFSNASAAASELVSDDAELVLDLAMGANYGSFDTDDARRVGRSITLKRRAFETAVYAGYKHFGIKRADIDKATLTINLPDVPEDAPAPTADQKSVVFN